MFVVEPSIVKTVGSAIARSSLNRMARTCISRQLMARIAWAFSGRPMAGSACSGAQP